MPAPERKRKEKVSKVSTPRAERPTKRARVSVPPGGKQHSKQATEPDSRPQNVKVRLGKRWSQIVTEVREGQYTWDEFVQELDQEEIARCQLRDENGTFRGRPPTLVPRAFQQACIKEMQSRFTDKLKDRLLSATDDLISLSRNGQLEGKDQAKVLVYLIERVMGPVPKQVVIQGADEPWQDMMTRGFTRPSVDGSPAPAPRRPDRYSKRRKSIDASEDVDD